ncbi:hypothetical protein HMN09_01158200 [Mycena chlorophos]|uniref:F-box domain-containing protein n=1 Tax=Mycena chlorophos TaxID=658473 RepID=A0A8H6S8J1_MYCCL|nr:hypothetical protein HMN09_01158200 [Mycena chlorophos]
MLPWIGFQKFFAACWRRLTSTGFIAWLSQTFQRLLGTPSRRPLSAFERLDSDVLGLIVSELPFLDRLKIFGLSRHLRAALFPILFRKVCSAPLRRPFPPKNMWPHIQVLVLAGDMEVIQTAQGVVTNDKLDYQSTFNQFHESIMHLTALRTVVIWPNINGGLWADLWQSLACIPWLDRLDLRPSEKQSALRDVLLGCSSTLEGVLIPGELLFRVIDQSVNWHALQELVVRGFWPLDPDASPSNPAQEPLPNARTPLLRLLETLPELRILRLNVSAEYRDPRNSTYIVGPNHAGPRDPATFLRHLTCFHFGSLLRGERILAFLPRGVQDIALAPYPLTPRDTLQQPKLRASTVLAIFRDVEFPNLRMFDVHYGVSDLAEVDAEETLLALFASKFANLRQLSVSRRWQHTESALVPHWNPVPRFRTLLSRLPALKYFQMNASVPERYGLLPFTYVDDAFFAHVERLRRLARDIVQDCPWLQAIGLYREFRSDPQFYWERWRVLPGHRGMMQLETMSI